MAQKKPLVIDFTTGSYQQLQAGDYLGVDGGGTGATTPSDARINLGLEIGVDVQAFDPALAGLTQVNVNGALFRTAAGVYAARSFIQPSAGITITNPSGVAGNPTLALSNDLAALELLAGTGFAVRTAADTWDQRSFDTASNARLTVTNPTGFAGNVTYDLAQVTDGGGGTFRKFTRDSYGRVTGTTNVTTADIVTLVDSEYVRKDGGTMVGPLILSQDAVDPMGAVTKRQLDAQAEGRRDKAAVRLLPTGNINVANPGTSTFDGVVANVGDRLLLVYQTAQAQNGPWVFNGSGVALTRPLDWDANAEIVSGATFFVNNGLTHGDSNWTLISDGPYVINTTAVVFTQTSSLGQIDTGNGVTKNGNMISAAVSGRLTFTGGLIDLGNSGVVSGVGYTKVDIDQYGRVIQAGAAVPSDIGAQPHSNELDGVAGLTGNGIVSRTAAGAYAPRALIQPTAGITITNPGGVAGNPTFALANDLAALEALGGVGFPVRTAADTYVQRTLKTAAAARLTVTNGDGVAGDPTVDLAATGVVAGNYYGMVYDVYGRLMVANPIANFNTPGSTLVNNETSQVIICSAVYVDGAGSFRKAVGNSDVTSRVFGLAFQNIASGQPGIIATSGPMIATAAEWDAVTGQSGGLTAGATYFLDNVNGGRITSTAPTSGFLQPVGIAENSTRLTVRIGTRFQL